MNINFRTFNGKTDQRTLKLNREFLATGVKGVRCIYAGPGAGNSREAQILETVMTREQIEAMRTLATRLCPDEHFGTVEVYEDGSLNVFGRSNESDKVFGAWTVRPDKKVKPIDLQEVVSVYSGLKGRCACGCSGKYSYASAHRDAASKHRGYTVDDDEIDDRMVKRIVNYVNAHLDEVEVTDNTTRIIYAVDFSDTRVYVVYVYKK